VPKCTVFTDSMIDYTPKSEPVQKATQPLGGRGDEEEEEERRDPRGRAPRSLACVSLALYCLCGGFVSRSLPKCQRVAFPPPISHPHGFGHQQQQQQQQSKPNEVDTHALASPFLLLVLLLLLLPEATLPYRHPSIQSAASFCCCLIRTGKARGKHLALPPSLPPLLRHEMDVAALLLVV